MRKRYQEGGIKKYRGAWIAQWWEDGRRRNRTIGRVSMITKTEAPGAACFDCDTPQYQAVVGVEESHAQRVCEAGLCPVLPSKMEIFDGSSDRAAHQLSLAARVQESNSRGGVEAQGPNQKRITKASLRNHLQALNMAT